MSPEWLWNFSCRFDRQNNLKLNEWYCALRMFPRLIFDRAKIELAPRYYQQVNCHGHALALDRWFQPAYSTWPISIHSNALPVWLRAVRRLGWTVTQDERDAECCIYTRDNNVVHSARRLSNGKWESKCGSAFLISNHRLNSVAGPVYGTPTVFIRKLKRGERENGK